jgi:SAM-dependent methyltransferase
MSCCSSNGTNKFFTKKSKTYLRDFRKKGLDKPSQMLVDELLAHDLKGAAVLEVGCGVGGLHITLLERGIGKAQAIDIASGMIDAAKELARERGVEKKIQYVCGDVLDVAEEITRGDVVVLDKVLCCYPEPFLLIEKTTEKSSRWYALTYPGSSLISRFFFLGACWVGKLLRWSFHPYYHDPTLLYTKIIESGFRRVSSRKTVLWNVELYERENVTVGDAMSNPVGG